MNQGKKEEHIGYWIRIQSKPAGAQAEAQRKLNFCTYLIHFFSNRWPCPPYCLDASGVGQAFTVTTPLLTFFFVLVGWLVLTNQTGINWLKFLLWSLGGGAVAGFFIGFVFAWKFNRTIRGHHIAIDRDELKTLIREVQSESR
ncbi:MAG: hypothetical protein ONB48_12195 [candidate division KSB1 bacterium]|nr:hypothetical protein [candidate division KSB1 bacterium]MDZ7274033.1 hypothetical protein [candidate division KSB1 bacterium]MDZ7286406.1 hypothetical protein [candidate division KSB1 bacterium]MDZ7296634.1 hypothetical protein [candidate division KSB1 bacterium]MDZ7306856.1 hypothetical protein [candidate division KSB1 bacterium]